MNVLYELKDHVAVVTINRPEALNALNHDVLAELDHAFRHAEEDNDVYVVVITGAGRTFVSGADLQQMKDFSPVEARDFSEYGNEVFLKIDSLSKPVIAAVNGYALGGGCELAMACDIRIAGEKTKFSLPEVGFGVIPGFGGTLRLPRIIGVSKAKELIFTGRSIGAEEALKIGLVIKVVPDDELFDTAMEMAYSIASKAQVAIMQAKAAIVMGMQCDIRTGAAIEAQAFALCFATEDQKDAMTAFVNKEKLTSFKNR